MPKNNVKKMSWGVIVTLSDGDVTHLKVDDYRKLEDQIAWVSDHLGLSVDAPIVEEVDEILYEMIPSETKKTNVERVTEYMELSKHGALSQMFVIEAINRYADQCANLTDEQKQGFANGMINADAWQAVAKEWEDTNNG
jgi:hypothetical protein